MYINDPGSVAAAARVAKKRKKVTVQLAKG